MSEAYSRDLLLLLRGLDRHAKLSAAAAATAGGGAADAAPRASSAQDEGPQGLAQAPAGPLLGSQQQPPSGSQRPWGLRGRGAVPYGGPPPELLEGVERFLVAKIPTGRMPPENVEGWVEELEGSGI